MALDMNTNNVYYLDMTGITEDTTITLANENNLATEEILTDWGDGTQDSELTHTYSTAGEYVVVSNLQNNAGGTDGLKDYITKMVVYYAKTPASLCFNYNKITEVTLTNNWAEKTIEKYGQKVSMTQMFRNCPLLELPNLELIKQFKPTYCVGMFYNCQKFTSIDLTGWDLSNCTDMNLMFSNCINLTEIKGIEDLNVSKITSFGSLFLNCSSLTSLDLSSWDISSVTNISGMFNGCGNLIELKLMKSELNNITNVSSMFRKCSSLTSIDLSSLNLNKVTTTQYMFMDCVSLTDIKFNDSSFSNTSNWADMFSACMVLTNIDLSSIRITKNIKMNHMFNNCPKLQSIKMFNCDGNVETIHYAFNGCKVLKTLDLSNLTIVPNISVAGMFWSCKELEMVDLSNIRDIGDSGGIFTECQKLTTLGLLYSTSNTINTLASKMSSTEQKTIYYQDADPSQLTPVEGVTFKKYQSTTLSLNEPIQLRSIGDIHDEINYETGEYIQRIGEVVFDGTEYWELHKTNGYFWHATRESFNAVNEDPISDKLIMKSGTANYPQIQPFDGIDTLEKFTAWLSENKPTMQFKLSTPIISTIDHTILDQNNSYKSSQQTYDESTYISVQSDTVVTPTSNIDYEIYSSTGTITGTSATIDNAEAGTPVSGVVYGETLLNVIQESSEDEFVCTDNFSGKETTIENSVAGNVKDVIIKGETEDVKSVTNYRIIENMQPTCTYSENSGTYWCDTTTVNPTVGNQYFIKIFNNPNNAITRFFYGGVIVDTTTDYGIVTATDRTGVRLHFYNLNSATVTITEEQKNAIRFLICEYQDGMENWEINEYFEESYTVKMPILKTTGKNLLNDNTSVSGWITEDGTTTIRGALGSGADYLSDFIYVGNINQIKINRVCYVTTFDENKKFISQFVSVVDVDVSNCSYIRIAASCDGQTALGLVGTIQVEEGSVVTTYEPHKSTTVTVNENIELNSIGDVCDELNVTTGELTKRIGKVVLDGSEDWQIDSDTNDYRLALALKHNGEMLQYSQSICDRYPTKTGKQSATTYNYVYIGSHSINLYENPSMTLEEFKSKLKQNPMTFQYQFTTESIKTVDLSIVDQDNVQQKYVQTYDTITYLKPQSYELIPTVEYKNPSYDVILKPNTEYTIKTNRTNRATLTSDVALDVNLGGSTVSMDSVTNHVKVKTPSTLENNTLTLSGFGNKVKDIMVIEGDYVDRDLDFFEGFISVENPIVEVCRENLVNPNILIANPNAGKQYKHTPYIRIEPNTMYCIRLSDYIAWYDSSKNQIRRDTGWGAEYRRYTSPSNASYAVLDINTANFAKYNATQEDISLIKSNTNIYKPYQGNTLTTYPQVTLRSIRGIKDEWDVVGETVTRRIGEIVLDGSEEWSGSIQTDVTGGQGFRGHVYMSSLNLPKATSSNKVITDKIANNEWAEGIYIHPQQIIYYAIPNTVQVISTITDFKQYLSQNPITVQYELAEPITESVRITPPNPQTSTVSITIPTQLNHVEDTSDFLVWNPYKEHYVRYNYVEDGVVLDNYTWENLTDLDERQFVEFYNKRTYIDQPYHNYVASHDSKGTSKYVLIEPNQDYTVNVRFSELPTCETVKVNLGGTEVEMEVNNPHVHVTTPNTLVNNLCSISGDGLDGKVTDILVIHCLEHEGFADIDYFEGIDGIGEIVEVDGVEKASIVMEQTNGNLIDMPLYVNNNGNAVAMYSSDRIKVRPNTIYRIKGGITVGSYSSYSIYFQSYKNGVLQKTENVPNYGGTITTGSEITEARIYTSNIMGNGSANVYTELELCYADMEKDYIRPRYYDKEEILLPMQLHRINTVYDNFYYDEMKGYYRIQQSIGHKYFVGADSENWTLIERGQRVLRFRYNNADIQMKSLGEFMTNRLPNGTATSPYECCAFSGSTFIVSIDKERLTSESLIAFKEWLANNNLHLYYQLASPLMIDLPQYPNRIEFNTYKDEIYTFFKNCKPTVFTLAVPLDQTYRFYDLEEGQGYANRIELTDERMTEEDKSYVHTIYGSGISNLIEEPNNVDTMLKPNYEGKATSHSLTNGKVSTIGVHGFEANDITIENYNTVTKQYELTVQAQQGTNTNTETLAVPYKLEIYEDGTKDRVYYNSQYKQWMFEGGQTLTVPYNTSTGAFTSAIEVFRGLQPRSGLIGEFKVRFASGTTSARLYYSINGTTYGYTTLRGMTDEVDYYIGFFNTGGTKIDMGTKLDANSEYTTLVPINATVPECLMINQIQSITECTYYQDKTYYYSDVVSPLLLDVYNGTTTITELNGAVIDIQNNAHNKQALIYGDTTYTVYWTYVGGEGNIKVTLGGVTQEVVATQGYATITTGNTDLERGLLIGGFNVTIKDLMLIKGERITDLKYFEGSRAVGTAFTDEDGNTMYKITFVTGSELINDKFEDMITFEDNKKHNVVVTKLLGAKPNKN